MEPVYECPCTGLCLVSIIMVQQPTPHSQNYSSSTLGILHGEAMQRKALQCFHKRKVISVWCLILAQQI